ncbi:MAG TPA: YbjN domain-containing protein [Sandaracinaceae bacterium LLY-WYZ-13_1]|nr:YbjN domain-containing protein [Sandaracinaceae bacterium LLY-WYZ-13_1]
MSSPLLESLRQLVEEDLDGVTSTPDGLRAVADTRYGEVTVRIDLDEDEQDEDGGAVRVSVRVPPPAGAGQEFLLFCLATNTQFWGVKIGLEDDGMLSVHADLDCEDPSQADELLASDVLDRVETILQLLDEDLVDYALAHGLGTPAQRARWERRRPESLGEDEADDDDDEV